MTDTRRRVKVYTLNEDRQWDDRGTGHVSSVYVDRVKGTSLLVRAESDGSLLLESKINTNTAYQKQQDTLIVWSEAENYDLALSFQEKAGCDEIWEKICQVQGKDPSVDITQDVVDELEEERFDDMSSPGLELPPCELNRLEDLAELVASSLPSPLRREKLALAVENEGYIRKLLELFRVCEDLENREGLHHLYEIIKGIFLLNRTALFEVMFSDECIMDVIGCLEFDPALQQPRRHREFLTKTARFKEVIPISDPELRQKIHQTYRVQYIQDMVLPTPSVFEENMLSTLHSFIFFNKVEIVGMLQDDEKFLTDLFAQLTDEATDDDKRHELVNFLKEFCAFSQTLQPQNRDAFFKTLSNMGILPALEVILGMDDVQVRGAATDIFSYLVEYNPSMVREFVMQESQQNDDDILLINLIIEHMICDTDPELGGAVQLMGLLRTLVDPDNMLATANKTEKTEFLSFFYKHCMHVLSAPLLANTTEEKPSKDDFQTSQLLALILELLTFCVEHHSYHIKNYIINKDILRRVLVLTASQHAFLALCALRFMRRIIGLKDEFYNRYIMRNFLFEPVVKAFLKNGSRYNLMNSAIIEMFEYVRVEDVKSLTAHIIENYWKSLEDVDYVQTFKGLKLRYEQQRERQDNPKLDSMRSILRNHRFRRDARTLEDEEEMWFNTDEEDLEDGEAVVRPSEKMKSEEDLMEPISKFMERKKLKDSDDKEVLGKSSLSGRQNPSFKLSFSGANKTSLSSPPSSASLNPGSPGSPESPGSGTRSSGATPAVTTKGGLVGLVDYPDDDEDEEDDEEDGESKDELLPPAKKSKLNS
ncbi:serine/threonine-protein phosphatase 4 regulatory subunit 3 isoform X1 [Corythoichthys intestinalis]|uniref:serine/threonine-protein phosphatase 4 regulatory subunit 3 isoform X1 n=1 Tax=Corythoichthys intestinalis TaxID=161448 RepID=UPI0025A544B0|nr:serine/threonine-protein phosphatase 4 regulatory subunit 3 isoform X1 [Corythoichthys intestinalis]XP_061806574.1 serine/threonine-protein phosphatase 4 regulatory subunit 3 [Nerophis lumbriciformis]